MSSARERCIALAVIAASCGSPKDTPPATTTGSGSGSVAVAEAPLPGAPGSTKIQVADKAKIIVMDEPKVELPAQESFRLVDAGAEPRAVLRYAPSTAAWKTTTSSELTTRRLIKGAWSEPAAIPAFRVALVITPDAPHRFALRALAAEVAKPDPQAEQKLAKWRQQLQGRTMLVDIDDRGQITQPRFNDDPTLARSADARDELYEILLSGVTPLPAEPVGLNASWRVVTGMKLGPSYGKQTATYTLTERSATRWKLHAKVQRVADTQRVTDPSLPAGLTVDLVALFRNVETDIEIDPTHPISGGGDGSFEQRMHLRFTQPGAGSGSAATTEQMFEDTGKVSTTISAP